MHALNFLRYWLLPLSFVLSGTAFNVKRDCGPNPTTLYSGQIKGVNPVGEGRSPVTFGWVNQGPSQGGTVGSGTGVGGNFQLELEGAQYSPSHSQPRGTFNFQSCGAGDTFYLICKGCGGSGVDLYAAAVPTTFDSNGNPTEWQMKALANTNHRRDEWISYLWTYDPSNQKLTPVCLDGSRNRVATTYIYFPYMDTKTVGAPIDILWGASRIGQYQDDAFLQFVGQSTTSVEDTGDLLPSMCQK